MFFPNPFYQRRYSPKDFLPAASVNVARGHTWRMNSLYHICPEVRSYGTPIDKYPNDSESELIFHLGRPRRNQSDADAILHLWRRLRCSWCVRFVKTCRYITVVLTDYSLYLHVQQVEV